MAETLITSSVISLMLCAIRVLFRGRIRLTVQYGLWGIAAAPLADRLSVRSRAVTAPASAGAVNPGQINAAHAGLVSAGAPVP